MRAHVFIQTNDDLVSSLLFEINLFSFAMALVFSAILVMQWLDCTLTVRGTLRPKRSHRGGAVPDPAGLDKNDSCLLDSLTYLKHYSINYLFSLCCSLKDH